MGKQDNRDLLLESTYPCSRIASSKALLIVSLHWVLTKIISLSTSPSMYSLRVCVDVDCGVVFAFVSKTCDKKGTAKLFCMSERILSITASFSR